MAPETSPVPPSAAATADHHIAFIHILRGVASLVVVWSHLSGFWLYLTGGTSAVQTFWADWVTRPFHVFENGGRLGVVIFFLISGYIITHTSLREDRVSYLIKRTFRIFPALVAALVVTWALLHVMARLDLPLRSFEGGGAKDWILSIFLLDGFFSDHFMLATTWTLVIELMFYTLVFVVIGRQRVRPLASTWTMAGLWVVGCLVVTNVEYLSTSESGPLIYLVGFLLIGRMIYFAHVGIVDALDSLILSSAVFGTMLLLLEARSPGYLLKPGGWPGYEPLTAFVTAIIVFLAMLRWAPRRARQPFSFLGDISYSLYLMHLPVGFALLALMADAGVPQSLATFLAIAGSIVASWISYHVVEKPAQRAARRLLDRVRRRRRGPDVQDVADPAAPAVPASREG